VGDALPSFIFLFVVAEDEHDPGSLKIQPTLVVPTDGAKMSWGF